MLYKTTEAQRKAWKVYRKKNREKILEKSRKNYPAYYAKNKEKYKAARRKWALAHPFGIKKRVLKLIGGAVCIMCGCIDIKILEINHRNGGGQQRAKQKFKETGKKYGSTSLMWDIIMGRISPSEFNVLCRVCNAIDYLFRKYGEEDMRKSYVNTKLILPKVEVI